jgi:hypothetical protein
MTLFRFGCVSAGASHGASSHSIATRREIEIHTLLHNSRSSTMQSPTMDDRPSKKRRFFSEDSSPLTHRFHRYSPTPEPAPLPPTGPTVKQESPHHIKKETEEETLPKLSNEFDGFDVALFQAVVGDSVPQAVLKRLKQISNNDVQKGMQTYRIAMYQSLIS